MLPDPIERMESRIDDIAFDSTAGLPSGKCRCYECGAVVPIESVETADGTPWSPPICQDCFIKFGGGQE
jgi:hypothetical protein